MQDKVRDLRSALKRLKQMEGQYKKYIYSKHDSFSLFAHKHPLSPLISGY